MLYANTFYLVYPSEKEVNLAKREYAKDIGCYTREQIDIGLKALAKLAISRERDDRIYREPNIPAFLALLDEVAKRDRAHKHFESLYDPTTGMYRLEDQTAKEKRYAEGIKHTSALLAMFEDPEQKPLTPAEQADLERLERIRNE